MGIDVNKAKATLIIVMMAKSFSFLILFMMTVSPAVIVIIKIIGDKNIKCREWSPQENVILSRTGLSTKKSNDPPIAANNDH